MSLISKSHQCIYRVTPHQNLAFAEYTNGHWCYSCNKGKFSDRSFLGQETKKITYDESIIFPSNATEDLREFSNETLAWLYNYYVYKDTIRKNHIHYVPYSYFRTSSGCIYEGESLIFPILIDNEIVAYQQRFFPDKQFYSKNIQKHVFDCGNHDVPTVVLVEDFISAIRIGEVENCIWLAGTSLSKQTLKYIIKNYTHIKIWLDGDEPGRAAAKTILNQLQIEIKKLHRKYSFNYTQPTMIKDIVTEQDPKSFSRTELERLLETT